MRCLARGLIEADHEIPTLYRGIPPTWPGLDLHYLFPTKFDQWLFERIGEALPRLPKEKARDLWQPILALGAKREHWLNYFLSDCFRAAAEQGANGSEGRCVGGRKGSVVSASLR